jgi:hypothetical protein
MVQEQTDTYSYCRTCPFVSIHEPPLTIYYKCSQYLSLNAREYFSRFTILHDKKYNNNIPELLMNEKSSTYIIKEITNILK